MNSDVFVSVTIFFPLNLLYIFFISFCDFFLLEPITILSEFIKSSQAYPSLKNSGLEHNSILLFLVIILFNFSLIVPGGTVDLITIIIFGSLYLLHIFLIILSISDKFTSPFLFSGVPTQINTLLSILLFIFSFVSNFIFFFFFNFFIFFF